MLDFKRSISIVLFFTFGIVLIKTPYILFSQLDLPKGANFAGIFGMITAHLMGAAGVFGLVLLFARKISGESLARVGIPLQRSSFRNFWIGAVLMMFSACLTWLVFLGFRQPIYQLLITAGFEFTMFLVLTVLAVLIQTGAEELLFRTWGLKTLGRFIGHFPAILLTGAIFGLAHLLNPNYSIFAMVNAFLAGVMMSHLFFLTRSFWGSFGLHFGWNFFLSGLVYNRILFRIILPDGTSVSYINGAEATFQGCLFNVIAYGVLLLIFKKTSIPDK